MFEKWNITDKIVWSMVLMVILFPSAIASYQVGVVYNMSNQSASDAAGTLTQEELVNLRRITADTGAFIDERMTGYFDGVYMMEEYAENLFNDRYNVTSQHSYFWDSDLEYSTTGHEVTNIQSIDDYESDSISFDMSCYYFPRLHYPTVNDPFSWDDDTQYVLEKSSNMDNIFRALHDANDDYIWLYMGFDLDISDNHVFRNYPYDNLEYFWGWYDDYDISNQSADYDPNIEEWYTNAVDISDDNVSVTLPYVDPSTGVVLSMGRPITFDNGTIIGVVSADVTMDILNAQVLSLPVSDNGYSFILDKSGGLIAHPKFTEEGQSIYDIEFGSSTSTDATAFRNILTTAIAGENGQEEITKDGVTWYLTYQYIPSTGMIVCTLVSNSDVTGPAISLLTTIFLQTTVMIVALVAVVGFTIVFGARRGRTEGKKMARPLIQAKDIMLEMSKGNIDTSIKMPSSYKEITLTMQSLMGLQDAMQIGNEAFVRGNLTEALTRYTSLYNICKDSDIPEGVQALELNIGNIHRQRGQLKLAEQRYNAALELAEYLVETSEKLLNDMDNKYNIKNKRKKIEELLDRGEIILKDASTSEDESKGKKLMDEAVSIEKEIESITEYNDALYKLIDAKNRVAEVYHNMASIEMADSNKNWILSMEYLEKAIEIHEMLDNKHGIAKNYDSMGICKMKSGDFHGAMELFDKSFELVRDTAHERTQAYIRYHRGRTLTELGDLTAAKIELLEAINLLEAKQELSLLGRALEALADVLDNLGEDSHDIRLQSTKLLGSGSNAMRTLAFVIDGSGSMSGTKIRDAVFGAKQIVENNTTEHHLVSITWFDTRPNEIRPLMERGNLAKIKYDFDRAERIGGNTAFYDALGLAIKGIDRTSDRDNLGEVWVIALTDGQDNASKKYDASGIVELVKRLKLDFKLRVIGVEVDRNTQQELENMCSKIDGAKYLPVSKAGDEKAGIVKQFEGIAEEMQPQLEIGGTDIE